MEEIKYPEKTTEQAALESTQIFLVKMIQHAMATVALLDVKNASLHHDIDLTPHIDRLQVTSTIPGMPNDPVYFTQDTETGKVSLFLKGFRLYVISGYVQRFMNRAWDELVALPGCKHCNRGNHAHANK